MRDSAHREAPSTSLQSGTRPINMENRKLFVPTLLFSVAALSLPLATRGSYDKAIVPSGEWERVWIKLVQLKDP